MRSAAVRKTGARTPLRSASRLRGCEPCRDGHHLDVNGRVADNEDWQSAYSPTPAERGMMDKPFMQIGEIAERTGLTQRTLRFYEERGLLQPATRLDGGFRLYTQDDLRRIERIASFRNVLKLSIPETKRMIEAEEAISEIGQQARQESDVEAKRQQLLQAVELLEREEHLLNEKIEQLQVLGSEWRAKLERYRQRLDQLDKTEMVPAGQARG